MRSFSKRHSQSPHAIANDDTRNDIIDNECYSNIHTHMQNYRSSHWLIHTSRRITSPYLSTSKQARSYHGRSEEKLRWMNCFFLDNVAIAIIDESLRDDSRFMEYWQWYFRSRTRRSDRVSKLSIFSSIPPMQVTFLRGHFFHCRDPHCWPFLLRWYIYVVLIQHRCYVTTVQIMKIKQRG